MKKHSEIRRMKVAGCGGTTWHLCALLAGIALLPVQLPALLMTGPVHVPPEYADYGTHPGIYAWNDTEGKFYNLTGCGWLEWNSNRSRWEICDAEWGVVYAQMETGDPDDPTTIIPWEDAYTESGCYPPLQAHATEKQDEEKPDEDTANTTDPINTITGNMLLDETDLHIASPGVPLLLSRHYISGLDYTNGPLGEKWTHSLNWWVSESTNTRTVGTATITNECLDVRAGSGKTYQLVKHSTNDSWTAYRDVNWSAEKLTNDTYELTVPPTTKMLFATNGVLTSVSDLWENDIALTYTNLSGVQRLAEVEHSNGKKLTFTYSGSLVSRIDTPSTNLYACYYYNASNELTNVVIHEEHLSVRATTGLRRGALSVRPLLCWASTGFMRTSSPVCGLRRVIS